MPKCWSNDAAIVDVLYVCFIASFMQIQIQMLELELTLNLLLAFVVLAARSESVVRSTMKLRD